MLRSKIFDINNTSARSLQRGTTEKLEAVRFPGIGAAGSCKPKVKQILSSSEFKYPALKQTGLLL